MCAARLSILLATYFQLSSICVHPCNIQFNPPFYFVKAFTHMNFKYFHSPVDLAFISLPPSTHLLFILCTTVCICSCLCVFYSCWSDLPLYSNSYPVHTLILTLSQYFLTRTHTCLTSFIPTLYENHLLARCCQRETIWAQSHPCKLLAFAAVLYYTWPTAWYFLLLPLIYLFFLAFVCFWLTIFIYENSICFTTPSSIRIVWMLWLHAVFRKTFIDICCERLLVLSTCHTVVSPHSPTIHPSSDCLLCRLQRTCWHRIFSGIAVNWFLIIKFSIVLLVLRAVFAVLGTLCKLIIAVSNHDLYIWNAYI